ncbi:MAG: asparagine synthase (glutamine-hydrolyzing) [Humidesulfovibrio sp.]|nr:asparagine synthase (glutamine-hydrolyzing) [Humidesulfovibrio sp.]
MCGIAGVWRWLGATVREAEVRAMCGLIAHRGPDGEGVCVKSGLGLGHRRLAILDVSDAGAQPMCDVSGRYWIVFNGEIYNFMELRRELSGRGAQFRTESDTEVLLAAFAQWGEACQLKLNGMWAFAIWDAEERTLFLSRDRFGVKPLHYLPLAEGFAFASEMKAFLALEEFEPRFDEGAVAQVLCNAVQLEGGGDCVFAGVRRLPPGHCMTLREGSAPQPTRWWNTLDHLPEEPGSFARAARDFRELFFDACRLRMRSDVPIGTALSGGLDSSSVICAMAEMASAGGGTRQAAQWRKAFVGDFPGTVQDEREYALAAASKADAEPLVLTMNPADSLAQLDEIIFSFEEIFDFVGHGWVLYRAMRQSGVVVSLDGHGGDELLAGYHNYPEVGMEDLSATPAGVARYFDLRRVWRGLYAPGLNPGLPGVWEGLKALRRGRRIREVRVRLAAKQPYLKVPPLQPAHPAALGEGPLPEHFDNVNRQLYNDFHCTVLPTILRNFDRVSMAHGVEIRAPFLDWRLVCLCFALPSSYKLGCGFSKLILREALRGVLPQSIAKRTVKLGFSSPNDHFGHPRMRDMVLDICSGTTFLSSVIWDGPRLRGEIELAFERGDLGGVRRFWPFIQAARLIDIFKEKKRCALPS